MRRFRYSTLFTVSVMAICCTGCVDDSTLESIAITKAPNKIQYVAGEMLDISGMEVTGYYQNGNAGPITSYQYSPGLSPLTTADTAVTVYYTNIKNVQFTASCPIVVTEPEEEDDPRVDFISITSNPSKTTYYVGETFDPTGMVISAHKTDDTVSVVTSYIYEPTGALQLTDNCVSIKYSGYTVFLPITVEEKDTPTPPGPEPTGYYAGINGNSSTLLTDLNSLNSRKRTSKVGYKNMKTYYSQTDPGKTGDQITAFYTGTSTSYSKMNKEHVWPDSLGGGSVDDDIHMPRPTLTSDNSSRGNEYYVEGRHGPSKPYKETGYDPGAFSANDATYRGDSARIIFYCAIANTNLRIVDTDGSSKPGNTMGKLSDLLKWNLNYPVQEREMIRNDAAEKIQGNRNPFIDHPEYACKIWGNTNATTRQICGM